MRDAPYNPETESIYECLECGNTVRAKTHPGECASCTVTYRNKSFPME